jgi:predicted HD superfamily hydrolase involved in NAD metabolism
MNEDSMQLHNDTLNPEIARQARAYLETRGFPKTASHCARVASQARSLAVHFDDDPWAAETAGWLHDISAVIPWDQRLQAAEQYGWEILPEERLYPMLLHQKLSASTATQEFGITEQSILSAVGCHTTLKAGASTLDKIVFTADKLEWDQAGVPPYQEQMRAAISVSLEAAALVYINYLWGQRDTLAGPLHPWLLAARQELSQPEAHSYG